jgi:serine/threonine protein kinase
MSNNSKNFNQIPYRLQKIGDMTNNDILDSMIHVDNLDTDVDSSLDDIREILPKKYIDFSKAIKALGGKLLYVKSGATGHTFKGVHLNSDKPSYGVKIVAYPRKELYGDMYNSRRPENTELLMIKKLAYFVKKKQTPHIVLPITTFNTSIKPFISLPKDNIVNNKKFDEFVKKYKKGEYYSNVSILISEWATGGDLLDYMKKHYKEFKFKHWQVIFFQILSVLAIIQNKYPGFRHNDLKANNILVNLIAIDKSKNNNFQYKINGQTYIVPNIGFQLKLWDFDFACIPDIIDNNKVNSDWTNKINVKPEQNRYYDIHYFINTLTKKGFFPHIKDTNIVPQKIVDFVNRIVPSKFTSGDQVTERGRILSNEEYFIPDDILKKDPLFATMRI